ncbi:MAG TPA: response regulator transcription factor [Candidatus Mediterraneibacter cottocaccae]|nr:response regulator transcription factor [Candidatus Mediterraneibacter cottocaccae]
MRLILIDDDCLVVSALKMILEAQPDIEVAATAEDGCDALNLYRNHLPDVLLMDIRMKDVDGLEAASQILAEYPDARILLLTTFQDDEYIIKALKIGACGYLLKQDYQNIVPALRAVCSGQTVFGGSIVSRIPDLIGKKAAFDCEAWGLSERETDVLALIAEGLSNKEIASRLYLSEGTVRNYLTAILDKLGLRDRTQAAIFYLERK